MNTRAYHGWIFASKEEGMKESWSVQYYDLNISAVEGHSKESKVVQTGVGEAGAAAAVEFFEKRLERRITLEPSPLGYRVFTE